MIDRAVRLPRALSGRRSRPPRKSGTVIWGDCASSLEVRSTACGRTRLTMTHLDIARQRLRNQCVSEATFKKPTDVVAWLGAVQAQDYAGAKWALGLRSCILALWPHAIDERWYFSDIATRSWRSPSSAVRDQDGQPDLRGWPADIAPMRGSRNRCTRLGLPSGD
jgi:hypothetical protein